MSTKYPGGLITKTPVTPAGPYQNGAAPGVWTVEQALQYTKQGIWPIAGNQDPANIYIEYLFSTYLVTSPQRIVNGLDLSGKGGLVWGKQRNAGGSHTLVDTVRGGSNFLQSNSTSGQINEPTIIPTFYSNGFETGSYVGSGNSFVYWGFRKQAKFFDVVTYTGTGSARTVAHNLGSVPGCIMVKCTNSAEEWQVYHTSLGNTQYLQLDSTNEARTGGTRWNNTSPTSTEFTVGTNSATNGSGLTFVAYIFASNSAGFGRNGTDNVISCGLISNAQGPTYVELGYEPQWVLFKKSTANTGYYSQWRIADNMRGMGYGDAPILFPNNSNAESNNDPKVTASATGFTINFSSGLSLYEDFIYIAVRRGPMQVPTDATKVLTLSTASAGTNISVGFPTDLWMGNSSDYNANNTHTFSTRLQGQKWLQTATTASEFSASSTIIWDLQNSFRNDQFGGTRIEYLLGRAPSFMDVVCYTGNGAGNNAQTHNLATAPELLIIKNRSAQGSGDWFTFHTFTASNFKKQLLDTTDAQTNYTYGSFLDAQPTSTTFTVNSGAGCNASGTTYVAYLFATCAGVSKVGSYTGTGTLTTINCGFTGGARWVLIKRTDSTSDWYIWDTTRGMVAGTDPSMAFNTTAAQTNANSVYTIATGFQLLASPSADVNTNGGSYIYLAIA